MKSSLWEILCSEHFDAADFPLIYTASESQLPEGLFIHSDHVLCHGQNSIFESKISFEKLHFNM